MQPGMRVTHGTLLAGRLAYAQPAEGYRTGIEPVLLAAAIPAVPGERVVEAGSGAGAGLLALSARVAGLSGTGLERDPDMVALGRHNLASNGFDSVQLIACDVTAWHPDGVYDHAFANPPWHDEANTQSPLSGRREAKVAGPDLLQNWAIALAAGLRRRGTLSLIVPAATLAKTITALGAARCDEVALHPFWPREGEAAKIILLRGIRDGRGPSRVLPGLVLHKADGSFTEAASAILRGEASIAH